jgi:hypothetical protein
MQDAYTRKTITHLGRGIPGGNPRVGKKIPGMYGNFSKENSWIREVYDYTGTFLVKTQKIFRGFHPPPPIIPAIPRRESRIFSPQIRTIRELPTLHTPMIAVSK